MQTLQRLLLAEDVLDLWAERNQVGMLARCGKVTWYAVKYTATSHNLHTYHVRECCIAKVLLLLNALQGRVHLVLGLQHMVARISASAQPIASDDYTAVLQMLHLGQMATIPTGMASLTFCAVFLA